MNLLNIIKNVLNSKKRIDIKLLPSQGLFYKDDFQIYIKKADIKDIEKYESNFDRDNLFTVITEIKMIVNKNVILSNVYKYQDIKSIDIIFLFLEIVKFSCNKEIIIPYFNDEIAEIENINFSTNNFSYFNFSKYMNSYDILTKEFNINGYKFSLPTIGIEDSLSYYLISKSNEDLNKWNNLSYNFIYFLNNKTSLTFIEIDNLIDIFNEELEEKEKNKIDEIVSLFSNIVAFTLQKDGKKIDVQSKIDLSTIWK